MNLSESELRELLKEGIAKGRSTFELIQLTYNYTLDRKKAVEMIRELIEEIKYKEFRK